MDIDLRLGDCLKILPTLPDASIDFILTDPPYGTTACKWDTVIPFEPMWKELKRVIKPNGAIALFGSEPFSSALRMSNIKQFKYDWVWDKKAVSNPQLAKIQPLKQHELICIFNSKRYFPQGLKSFLGVSRQGKSSTLNHIKRDIVGYTQEFTNYPKTILTFKVERGLHPTQKPVALLEYLIKTYTLEGETVLDFTMGSGSTGVACKNLGRKFIGIEHDEKYFQIAKDRIG